MKHICRFTLLVCLALTSIQAGYVTALWTNPGSVGILDNNFALVTSFNLPTNNPNGIATDGSTIWVATFSDQTVRRYDFGGALLGSFTDATLGNAQGMELVNGELAVASGASIWFFNPISGASIRSIPNPPSNEGLAFDGSTLWKVGGTNIVGLNPATGAVLTSIPNPADSCSFGGTGLTSLGGGQLAAGCSNGNWYIFSSTTGVVSTSGNNQLPMYGLKAFGMAEVPEPGTFALMGLALAALGLRRR